MDKNSKISPKAAFWKQHIEDWSKSGLTQGHYCHKQGISKTAFSKWKVKLHHTLKGKSKTCSQKSSYFKYTKLSDNQIEWLMRHFIMGLSAKDSAKHQGISEKSVYNYYDKFRSAHLDGAFAYPQLFLGTGMLLLLGPPPDIKGKIKHSSSVITGSRGYVFNDQDINQRMSNKIKIIYQILVYNSLRTWTTPEIFLFKQMGYQIFFRHIYAPHHKLDSDTWNAEVYTKLSSEFAPATIARTNWDHWATDPERKLLLHENLWAAIYFQRGYINDFSAWEKQLCHDLRWVVKKHNIGAKRKLRSKYWDEYQPSQNEINQAALNLNDIALELQSLKLQHLKRP